MICLLVHDVGDSTRLITSNANQTVKLWNVVTGTQLFSFNFESLAREMDLAEGHNLAVITTYPFMEFPSIIHIKRIEKDLSKCKQKKCLLFCSINLYNAFFHDWIMLLWMHFVNVFYF